jgi:hypothetical protein
MTLGCVLANLPSARTQEEGGRRCDVGGARMF